MSNLRRLSVLAGLLFGAAGCGTMANLDGRKLALIDLPHQEVPTPFGGVGRDVRWISSGGVFFVADIPLSLIGDIVTLPKVAWIRLEGYELWWGLQPDGKADGVNQPAEQPVAPDGAGQHGNSRGDGTEGPTRR
jgi:hypothetical protein